MAGWLVLIAGPVRSGKSSLATYIAGQLDGMLVRFGDAVRQRALDLGLPPERASWQRLGERWVDEDPAGLCDVVLAPTAGRALVVVDGVRHVHIYRLLRERAAGRRLVLIYVHADVALRRTRLGDDGLTGEEIDEVLAHSTEAEAPRLRSAADIVADGTARSEPVLDAVRAMMPDGTAQNSR